MLYTAHIQRAVTDSREFNADSFKDAMTVALNMTREVNAQLQREGRLGDEDSQWTLVLLTEQRDVTVWEKEAGGGND